MKFKVGQTLIDRFGMEWEIISLIFHKSRLGLVLHGEQLKTIWADSMIKMIKIGRWRVRSGEIPAVPPNDYEGPIAAWIVALLESGLWNGFKPEFYGHLMITQEQYQEILKKCEGK
jgi:hypothetical protein